MRVKFLLFCLFIMSANEQTNQQVSACVCACSCVFEVPSSLLIFACLERADGVQSASLQRCFVVTSVYHAYCRLDESFKKTGTVLTSVCRGEGFSSMRPRRSPFTDMEMCPTLPLPDAQSLYRHSHVKIFAIFIFYRTG